MISMSELKISDSIINQNWILDCQINKDAIFKYDMFSVGFVMFEILTGLEFSKIGYQFDYHELT